MDMSVCADCGPSMFVEIVQCFIISLALTSVLALVKRLVLGSDRLIITRIV